MSCVLFTEHPALEGKKVVEITLNAERSLNALSLEMIRLIQPALDRYRDDDSVVAIILDGSGEKAFCAGGDVVSLYHALQKTTGGAFATEYFSAEYRLDYTIHTYPKPIIGWGAGIVMGGGLGLLAGCRHSVVTETTMIAMPEVTIGLYPDVGASWFLNRCPGRTGLFLGMTGQRINGADAKFIGIAKRQLDNSQRPELLAQLLAANWSDPSSADTCVANILRSLESQSAALQQISLVREHYDLIQTLCDVDSAGEFVEALLKVKTDDNWVNKAQRAVSHGSPLSIAIIYRQLHNSKYLSLKEVFIAELSLSVQCCVKGELAEGVRALLVDKDGQPNWRFTTVAQVEAEFLDQLFTDYWPLSPIADM
ncbi:MAG: enoyl-CoA hydratase/isomerase family protein [Oceanospirillaceae bacterium]|nr:enoyl-CoA hydratase/isomerase family protein [Oceanospirillaceae bacterium]